MSIRSTSLDHDASRTDASAVTATTIPSPPRTGRSRVGRAAAALALSALSVGGLMAAGTGEAQAGPTLPCSRQASTTPAPWAGPYAHVSNPTITCTGRYTYQFYGQYEARNASRGNAICMGGTPIALGNRGSIIGFNRDTNQYFSNGAAAWAPLAGYTAAAVKANCGSGRIEVHYKRSAEVFAGSSKLGEVYWDTRTDGGGHTFYV